MNAICQMKPLTLYYRVQMKHTIFGFKASIGLTERKKCAAKGAKIKQIENDFFSKMKNNIPKVRL